MWDVDFKKFVRNCFKAMFSVVQIKEPNIKEVFRQDDVCVFTLSFRTPNSGGVYPERTN